MSRGYHFKQSKVNETMRSMSREEAKAYLDKLIARTRKANETAKSRRGRRVRSVEELCRLAEARRSVYCDGCWGLKPAAVIANMTAAHLAREIREGRVFTYNSGGKRK